MRWCGRLSNYNQSLWILVFMMFFSPKNWWCVILKDLNHWSNIRNERYCGDGQGSRKRLREKRLWLSNGNKKMVVEAQQRWSKRFDEELVKNQKVILINDVIVPLCNWSRWKVEDGHHCEVFGTTVIVFGDRRWVSPKYSNTQVRVWEWWNRCKRE